MSVHDPSGPRKPNRWGLYAPFLLLLVAMAAWSVVWIWARNQVQAGLDAAAASWRQAGYDLTWKTRAVGGYPFRLDVTLTDVSLRERSGWALLAPRIEAEAYAYAPSQWLVAATEGLTFVRPPGKAGAGGPVTVSGELIRASLSHPQARPPSLSFEGVKLAFLTPPGAAPFALTAADRVEFHLRAGPDDQGGVFATVTNGKARLQGLFARIGDDGPVSFEWNSTLSRMSGFAGADWADAVRRWTAGGGRMTVRQGMLTAGAAQVVVKSGTLGVGPDGRLSGALDVALRRAPQALAALGQPPEAAQAATTVVQAQGDADIARGTINFLAGATTLGPVALGPAPRVYSPD